MSNYLGPAQQTIENALQKYSPSDLLDNYLILTGKRQAFDFNCSRLMPDALSSKDLNKDQMNLSNNTYFACNAAETQANEGRLGWVVRHTPQSLSILVPLAGLADLLWATIWQPDWLSRCVGGAQLLIGFAITARLVDSGRLPALLAPPAIVVCACAPAWAVYGMGKLAAAALQGMAAFAAFFSTLGAYSGFAVAFVIDRLSRTVERVGEESIERGVNRILPKGHGDGT